MSTQRYISTSFWDDRWIRGLDPSERYLYLYLLTNTLTNISGIYQITLDRIAYDTGYDERTLSPMLERFKKSQKAVFVCDEWMILPSWPKHQKWETKATIKAGIESALKNVPKRILYEATMVSYAYPIDSLLVGYTYQPSYSDSDSDSDSDSECDTEPPIESAHTRFKKPTLQEVLDYCKERRNTVNAQRFIDYYESKGWKVGRDGMKDWKASVRTWEASEKANPSPPSYSVTLPDWQKKLSGATDDRN